MVAIVGTGIDLNQWKCGRVVYGRNTALAIKQVTCGEFVKWIPIVHVRRGGEQDCTVVLGAHALCNSCRLGFRLAWLKEWAMWESVVSHFKADGYGKIADREIEMEWFAVEDYLAQVRDNGPA